MFNKAFVLACALLVGVAAIALATRQQSALSIDSKSGLPLVHAGEYHSPVRPGGPWIATRSDGSRSELVCLNGARVPLPAGASFIDRPRGLEHLGFPDFAVEDYPIYSITDGTTRRMVRCSDGKVLFEAQME
jgi:hypothetical protein